MALSVSHAEKATLLAQQAVELHGLIKGWDSSPRKLEIALETASGRKSEGSVLPSPVSPFAKLNGLEFDSTVAFFDAGSDVVKDAGGPELTNLGSLLSRMPNVHVTLIGYADARGREEFNLLLAFARAEGVADLLIDWGADPNQIEVIAVGEPADSDADSEAERQLEKKVLARVTFGMDPDFPD